MTADRALIQLLSRLRACDYQFVAVTPATHSRVLARPLSAPPALRDIFGWNRIFGEHELDPTLLALLRCSGSVEDVGGKMRSLVRVGSLAGELFLHSSFPTTEPDAVFFGPDTFRFASFVSAQLPALSSSAWIVDMGSGSGAGGVVVARRVPGARLTLVDVNPAAARLARVNASFARVPAEVRQGNQIPAGCDLVIANPPYMIDASHRRYRDGGAMYGGEVACSWTVQALRALKPGGTLLLYTGVAVLRGNAPVLDHITSLCTGAEVDLSVEELDPDVFGEELERPEYAEVDRIAAVGIKIGKH